MGALYSACLASLLIGCWWVYHHVWLFVCKPSPPGSQRCANYDRSHRATITVKTEVVAG